MEIIKPVPEPQLLSNRARLQLVYQKIIDTVPLGALMFLITNNGVLHNNSWMSRLFRMWQGFDPNDTSNWHTAIYVGAEKERNGGRWRPQMIHAHQDGTTKNTIPREYFNDTDEGERTKSNRLEFLIDPSHTSDHRGKIVDFAISKVGLPFDGDPGWKREWRTYLLGIRSRPIAKAEISCHGLAYEAYALNGRKYAHHLEHAPNALGRIFGHPIGHPADYVDQEYLYLRDHHLYRNPQFKVVLAAFKGITEKRYGGNFLPKYSWDPDLQLAYGMLGVKSNG
jgi:hypothetical protein